MTDRDVSTDDPGDSGGDSRLNDEFRDYLLAQGADLVGFGLVSHLAGAPEIMQPRRYLPDARSMIAIGLHINEASCDLIERSVHDGTCRRRITRISCSRLRLSIRSSTRSPFRGRGSWKSRDTGPIPSRPTCRICRNHPPSIPGGRAIFRTGTWRWPAAWGRSAGTTS